MPREPEQSQVIYSDTGQLVNVPVSQCSHYFTTRIVHQCKTFYLTAYLLLPAHLIIEVVKLREEIVDLAALVIPLGCSEHARLGLLCQVLTDVGHWKHYLLHGAVVTHNLTKEQEQK